LKIDQKERKNGLAQSHQRPKNTLGAYVNDHVPKYSAQNQTPVMHSRNMKDKTHHNLPGPSASTDQKMAETWKMKDSSGATPDKGIKSISTTPFSNTTPKEARHTLHTFDAVPLYDPVK